MGIAARIFRFVRERRLGERAITVGRFLLGAKNPEDDPAPAFVAIYRKAIAAGVGALVGWLVSKGWDVGDLQDELEIAAEILVSGFFAWLARNKPQTAG